MYRSARKGAAFAAAGAAVALGLSAAPPAEAAEYGNVISSIAVTQSVPVQRQVCTDGQQVVQQRPSGAGAVIGAIAGGVLGSTIGGGFGRAAATGFGVVAGSVVGDQVESNSAPYAEVPVRRCQMVGAYENRVVGYDVTYDYAGQRYTSRMPRDPGRQIALNVQPSESAPTVGTPVPTYSGDPIVSATPPTTAYYDPLPQPAYYPAYPPAYVSPYYYGGGPAVYVGPTIGVGFGFYGGGRGGHRWH